MSSQDVTLSQITLWLTPPPDVASSLAQLISSLSQEYNTPVFAPHITLLTSISPDFDENKLTEQVKHVIESHAPFKVTFCPPASGETSVWQCVFLPVEPCEPLLQLRADVEKLQLSAKQSNASYFPHLSLVYGSLDSKQRESLVQKATDWLQDHEHGSFEISHVDIARCVGRPEEWKLIDHVSLRGTLLG